MPRLQEIYTDEDDLLEAVADEAETIAYDAPAADSDYVHGRIDCMLKNAGAIPGEEEGEPSK